MSNIRVQQQENEDPAYVYKKRWETSERERVFLSDERDRLLEELEISLMRFSEQGHEVAALYRLMEDRAASHSRAARTSMSTQHSPSTQSGLATKVIIEPAAAALSPTKVSKWKGAKSKFAMTGALGALRSSVQTKIALMRKDGLLEEIDSQLKEEKLRISKLRSMRSFSKRSRSNSYIDIEGKLGDNGDGLAEQIDNLKEKEKVNLELLRQSELEIKRLSTVIKEKNEYITKKMMLHAHASPSAMGKSNNVMAMETQTPSEWMMGGKLSNSEKKEIEAESRRERKSLLSSVAASDNSVVSAREQAVSYAHQRQRRTAHQGTTSEVLHTKEPARKPRETMSSRRKTLIIDAQGGHPLKTTELNEKSAGIEALITSAKVLAKQPPPLSRTIAEELAVLILKEKWEHDIDSELSGKKFIALPESALNSLVIKYDIRAVAMKVSRANLQLAGDAGERLEERLLLFTRACRVGAAMNGIPSSRFVASCHVMSCRFVSFDFSEV